MNDALFSRNSDEWETPVGLFAKCDKEFHFQIDVAATAANAKCDRFFDKIANGLDEDWATRNWCNPPYSQIGKWVLKARREQLRGNLTAMLIPARTDTRWFHSSIYKMPGVEIRFLPKRIVFVGANWNAPFPSMLVIFNSIYPDSFKSEQEAETHE